MVLLTYFVWVLSIAMVLLGGWTIYLLGKMTVLSFKQKEYKWFAIAIFIWVTVIPMLVVLFIALLTLN